MSNLSIDNRTTVTNVAGQSLNVTSINSSNTVIVTPVIGGSIGVVTVGGPMGPSGASITGPPGPMGTGSAQSISGYATGLFSGPVGDAPIIRATTGYLLEVLGNGVSGSAPAISNVNLLVSQPVFGLTGFLLGQPDGWWSFLVSGRTARIPYYYA